MSRSRLPLASPTLDLETAPSRTQDALPAGLDPMLLAQRAGGGGNSFAQALLGPALSGALGACFGPAAARVPILGGQDAANRSIGALASSDGRSVSLSSQVDPAGGDRLSLEILGHEIAHALAGGGSGQTELDQPGDPGEARADLAGARFADFVEGGMTGPAPRLAPATGGRARIHRWEGAEHLDAVEGAVQRLEDAGEEVDPDVAARMQKQVTLGNGMTLTPGQITALMGDFYGAFDKDGNFDPDASFQQIWNADPEEMQTLLSLLEREKQGEVISSNEWETATAGRRARGEMSYLDLAQRNTNHYSASTMEGTDNNMGTYSAFHERALAMAAKGGPEAENMALALEACGNHYLTDRFSAGHQFDKDALMASTEHAPDGKAANGHAKWTHDQMNTNGVPVWSAGEDAETWTAMGDGQWRAEGGRNQANQRHAAEALYASYQELDAVLEGEATPEQIREEGYATWKLAPQWSDERQEQVEAGNRTIDGTVGGDAAIATPYVDDLLTLIGGRYVVNPLATAADHVVEGAAVAGKSQADYQQSLKDYGVASPRAGEE